MLSNITRVNTNTGYMRLTTDTFVSCVTNSYRQPRLMDAGYLRSLILSSSRQLCTCVPFSSNDGFLWNNTILLHTKQNSTNKQKQQN